MQSAEIRSEGQILELVNQLIDEVEGNAFVSLFFDGKVRDRYETLKEAMIVNQLRGK